MIQHFVQFLFYSDPQTDLFDDIRISEISKESLSSFHRSPQKVHIVMIGGVRKTASDLIFTHKTTIKTTTKSPKGVDLQESEHNIVEDDDEDEGEAGPTRTPCTRNCDK